jgi:uncharacterized protein (DUF2235 family)
MYASLVRNYANGDQVIDIVGFSRGSALALEFANMIATVGVREWLGTETREGPTGVLTEVPVYRYYARPGVARIRFLGLFDVVASFGLAKDMPLIPFQRINLGYRLGLPKIVDHAAHAMALHENRHEFQITRVPGACEAWLPGGHGDVGGSNANCGLNDYALQWMLDQAQSAGVRINRPALSPDPSALPRVTYPPEMPYGLGFRRPDLINDTFLP